VNGLVVVDKEAGWTSHDVVARCRRILSERRVGHAGTLDPDATGVLLVGVGRVTRLLRFLTPLTKTYRGEVVLGTATDTLDSSGEVTGTWDMAGVSLAEVEAAARTLTGDIDQVPPMVSAIKIDGQRLYQLARAGQEVARPARRVRVLRFDVEPAPDPGVYRIEVDCSAGTYIRSLAADLGTALGGGAHLRALRRSAIGPFIEADAHRLGEVESAAAAATASGHPYLLSPAEAVRHLQRIDIDAEMARLVSRGLPLDRVSLGAEGEGPWALVDAAGQLAAVYEATDTDRVRPAVVLAAAG
jgi:tRNA pseudouridine55 synthase